jgi:hypothetical protein
MSVRESVFQEQQIREAYNTILGTNFGKSVKGDIIARFKRYDTNSRSVIKYDDNLSVLKDLLKGVKFSDFEIDFDRSNFNKHDMAFLELEIKSYKSFPTIGGKFLSNETLKISQGRERDLDKLKKNGLTESQYNEGTILYNDLLNFHNIHKLIVIKGVLFFNKLNNELSYVTVEVQPSTISKGKLQRVKNDFVIESSVVVGSINIISLESTEEVKVEEVKERKSNWFRSLISDFVEKYSDVPNLESHLIKSGVLGYSKRGQEMIVNGLQLFLQSKDATDIKLNKISKLYDLISV